MALNPLKVRRIEVNGTLAPGVYAKDVILHIIRKLGVNGGTGFAYEYGGTVFDGFSMEERMTACNMSIEGGARVGYVNPDEKTFEYLKGQDIINYSESDESTFLKIKTQKLIYFLNGRHYLMIISHPKKI